MKFKKFMRPGPISPSAPKWAQRVHRWPCLYSSPAAQMHLCSHQLLLPHTNTSIRAAAHLIRAHSSVHRTAIRMAAGPQMPPLEGFLQRIKENNCGLEELPTLTPFMINGKTVGQLKPGFVDHLSKFQVFKVKGKGPQGCVTLSSGLDTPEARTKAVAEVLEELRQQGVITGWRNELYPVTSSFYSEPDMLVERAAATHFGIKAYGIHCNGYVVRDDGGISLWVARRSKNKPNWPGKLDHIVAGGQPHGLSPDENLHKECQEEAGISPELAATAKPAGAVSYLTISATGLKPDVLFVYDIQLPTSFQPVPQDGEVEEFMLWPIEKVAQVVATTTEFKTNCNLVIIDFLVRHGFLSPNQPGYLQLVAGLRMGDCT